MARDGFATLDQLQRSGDALHRASHASLGFAQPLVATLLATQKKATRIAPRVVFNLRSTETMRNGTMRMRRAFEPGESVEVKLRQGETMRVSTSPGREGRLHVELEYVDIASGSVEHEVQDMILPAHLDWQPRKDGPVFHLSFRRHRPISLILDGDPLSWMMGGDWETRNSWRRS